MTDHEQTYGGCLYSELRKLSGYNVVTRLMDYKAIQQLKVSDRDGVGNLFRGSSDEVLQVIQTSEPEEVARYLVAKITEPSKDDSLYTASILLMINSL